MAKKAESFLSRLKNFKRPPGKSWIDKVPNEVQVLALTVKDALHKGQLTNCTMTDIYRQLKAEFPNCEFPSRCTVAKWLNER
jgi:hypothetical protein